MLAHEFSSLSIIEVTISNQIARSFIQPSSTSSHHYYNLAQIQTDLTFVTHFSSSECFLSLHSLNV